MQVEEIILPEEIMTSAICDLKFDSRMIFQVINSDKSSRVTYVKSIKEIENQLKHQIPYNQLINIFYICSNKGGGKSKLETKKRIQRKYVELLKHIRIFDIHDSSLMHNEEFFQRLILNQK